MPDLYRKQVGQPASGCFAVRISAAASYMHMYVVHQDATPGIAAAIISSHEALVCCVCVQSYSGCEDCDVCLQLHILV